MVIYFRVLCVIVATARSRYESLKKHTQDELKHTIDAMLDTETKVDYVTILTFLTEICFNILKKYFFSIKCLAFDKCVFPAVDVSISHLVYRSVENADSKQYFLQKF